MNQTLRDVYNAFLLILNNENYMNAISMVVVAITSYRIAKYNASKPEKLKIKQMQFIDVYLPLFRILSLLPNNPTLDEAIQFHAQISIILDKHYELVFPQLHRLNQELELDIYDECNYQNTLVSMRHQVEVDYELLKKTLGYPSSNFGKIFVRMPNKQKLKLILSSLSLFSILWTLLLFVAVYTHHIDGISFLFLSAPTTLIMSLSLLTNKM